jgi:hypothetical protein
MKRSEILDTAKEYVTKDRASQHGDAENNLNGIASGWDWWMSVRQDGKFSAMDVAVMMTILKITRASSNPSNSDNFIDACGYMSLAGECA